MRISPITLYRIGERIVAQADSKVVSVVGGEDFERGYRNSLSHRGLALGGGAEKQATEDISSIDTKVGPLLTHVSIMIAAIAAIISSLNLSVPKKTVFGLEMAIYLVLAIACLRCIDQQPTSSNKTHYTLIDHSALFSKQAVTEAMIKSAWFMIANKATIILTLFLLISTPVILLA